MKKKHLEAIYKVANELDRRGYNNLADRLDKVAEDISLSELNQKGILSTAALDSGYHGPVNINGKWYAHQMVNTTRAGFVEFVPLDVANTGGHKVALTIWAEPHGTANVSLAVTEVVSPQEVKVLTLNNEVCSGESRYAMSGRPTEAVMARNDSRFPAINSILERCIERTKMSPAAKDAPFANSRKQRYSVYDPDVYTLEEPHSTSGGSRKGFATLGSLLGIVVGLVASFAIAFAASPGPDDERLKNDTEALLELLKLAQAKPDLEKRRKTIEYASNKIKDLKRKIGQEGYVASTEQRSALDKLDSDLDKHISSLGN